MSAEPDRVARHLAQGRRAELSATTLKRAAPDAHRIARRQLFVRWSKLVLPAAALALLGSIAIWPEVNRSMRVGRTTLHEVTGTRSRTGVMSDARYHGIDSHGRPYMITARNAEQIGSDRIDLTAPKADIFAQGGQWLMLTADRGVYAPHSQVLDLSGNVVLYRDDGTMMYAQTATIDVRRDVDASRTWVHIEGPFGELDAPSYFMSGHDGVLQFRGPARLVLNDTRNANTRTTGTTRTTK